MTGQSTGLPTLCKRCQARPVDPSLEGICRACGDEINLSRAAREFLPPRSRESMTDSEAIETPGFRTGWAYTAVVVTASVLCPGLGHAVLGIRSRAIRYGAISILFALGGFYFLDSLLSIIFFSCLFTLHMLVLADARQRERARRQTEGQSHVVLRDDRWTSLAMVFCWYLLVWLTVTQVYQFSRVNPYMLPIFSPDLAPGDRLILRRAKQPIGRGSWVIINGNAVSGRGERFGCVMGIPGDEIVWTGSEIRVNERIIQYPWIASRIGSSETPDAFSRKLGDREYYVVTPVDRVVYALRFKVPLVRDEFVSEKNIGQQILYRYYPIDRMGRLMP